MISIKRFSCVSLFALPGTAAWADQALLANNGGGPGGNLGGLLHALLLQQERLLTDSVQFDSPGQLTVMLAPALVVLSAIYGCAMGLSAGLKQAAAAAAKVPLLLIATLAICFPAMAVSTLLLGIRLDVWRLLNLMLLALTLHACILASLSPIAGFFGLGSDYHFLKLLHVALFGVSGFYSMNVLRSAAVQVAEVVTRTNTSATWVFLLWVIVYGFVGCQMAWLLRPFVGFPGLPYEFLRRKTGGLSFYTAVWSSVQAFRSRDQHPNTRCLDTGQQIEVRR